MRAHPILTAVAGAVVLLAVVSVVINAQSPKLERR